MFKQFSLDHIDNFISPKPLPSNKFVSHTGESIDETKMRRANRRKIVYERTNVSIPTEYFKLLSVEVLFRATGQILGLTVLCQTTFSQFINKNDLYLSKGVNKSYTIWPVMLTFTI